MKRRDFIAASCLAGLAPLGRAAVAAEDASQTGKKEYYELRLYRLASKDKQAALEKFLGEAAIPAWGKLGIGPVGVFELYEDESPNLYVLLPAKSAGVLLLANTRLMSDPEFLKAGAAVLGAAKDDPA